MPVYPDELESQVPRKPTETVQVNLRMKEAMRRRLEQAAKKADISLNAEMLRRLEESFDRDEKRSLVEVTQRLEAVTVALKAEGFTTAAPVLGTPTLTENPAVDQSKDEQK